MTRHERLLRTLRGEPVDRPAVSFYEIGFFDYSADDPDPYNVHNDPSWRPLLELARNRTDIIRSASPHTRPADPQRIRSLWKSETETRGTSRFTRTTLALPNRSLTQLTRRDAETDTVWTLEHLMKEPADVDAFLAVPPSDWAVAVDCAPLHAAETAIGDAGIVCVDTADPLCNAAALFSMEDYTVLALTDPTRFHRLLSHFSERLMPVIEQAAGAFPGHLWRIYGPEYASEPYLPPHLFHEYVNTYTGRIVNAIRRTGGFARIHCHGRLRAILPHIAAMGADGLDPVEPPPQGDIGLAEVRHMIGGQTVLFGNIEIADIENLKPADFEPKVIQALREGTADTGRGFVLMPSACPYGRTIKPSVLENYRLMVEHAENWHLTGRAPNG